MSDLLRSLFQLGQSEHSPAFVRRDVLAWLADQGRVAVVRLSIDYCPHTDAALPTPSRRLHATADDVDQAYDLLARLYEAEEAEGGDDWFEIWGRDGRILPTEAPQPALVDDFDSVPF